MGKYREEIGQSKEQEEVQRLDDAAQDAQASLEAHIVATQRALRDSKKREAACQKAVPYNPDAHLSAYNDRVALEGGLEFYQKKMAELF